VHARGGFWDIVEAYGLADECDGGSAVAATGGEFHCDGGELMSTGFLVFLPGWTIQLEVEVVGDP